MVFSSLPFWFQFLPIVLLLYFAVPKRFKNAVLFAVSLLFYAWGEPIYIVLMLFSTAVDYTHGLLVERFIGQGKRSKAKLIVASSMFVNIFLLCFFKYSDLLIASFNGITGLSIPLLNLPLPIGISFYTFQTMSYTVDVYRGKAAAQKNIISFGAYVALFPQLIAGPIVQYNTIAKELQERKETVDDFSYGIVRFMTGLGKKVLLANNIGLLWDQISSMPAGNIPALTAWIGVLAFAFQIYFDFSGYSDMAIGLGRMLGFKFLENFNYPYMSKSITEFWRRWHISLGSWFRDYLYIPLGGNRKGFPTQIRNICIVWLATGIWHGANWNFLVWGAYFGIILILEKLFLLKLLDKLPSFVRSVYTLFLVAISWIIFAFEDMGAGLSYLGAMFGANEAGLFNSQTAYILITNIVMLSVLALASTNIPKKAASFILARLEEKPVIAAVLQNAVLAAIFIVSLGYLVDASYNPFLYFRF